MKISMLCYEPVPTLDELDRRMALAASLGYAGIELTATHPLGYSVDDIAALVDRHKLPVVSFLSGWSYPNEGLCLSSPDSNVRLFAADRLAEYAAIAARLGAVVVVGLMQGLRSDEPDPSTANDRIVETLRIVAPVADDLGTTLVLEPVNHYQVGFNNTAAEARAIVDRVDSPGMGYMLDTVHMNIEERSIVGTIREHGPSIRHFHLCETNGGRFGTGGLDFPSVMAALRDARYDRFASVKVYRGASYDEAARGSAEFLRGLGVDLRG